jgi:hypothetical protein
MKSIIRTANISMNSRHPAKCMMGLNKPIGVPKESLEKIGENIVVFIPYGDKPGQSDFLKIMCQILESLRSVFK